MPKLVRENLQFQKAREVLKHWHVYLRPTPLGLFVLRFQRKYERPTPLIEVAEHVLDLQRPLDVPSAIRMRRKLEGLREQGEDVDERVASIDELLKWARLGADSPTRMNYPALQSLFALEISSRFMQAVGANVTFGNGTQVDFALKVDPVLPTTHDSFVVYHIDEMLAPYWVVRQANEAARTSQPQNESPQPAAEEQTTEKRHRRENDLVRVSRQHIRDSLVLRSQLLHLLEGAVLQRATTKGDKQNKPRLYFPDHQLNYIDKILDLDMATWAAELCLLTSRVAVIMPSRRAARDNLFISTLPRPHVTSGVTYQQYWEALERLIEFVVEARVMAQLVDRQSSDVLRMFSKSLGNARSGMARGDIELDHNQFGELADRAANLSRLVGISYGLSNPHIWSRAEYAVEKAAHLINEMRMAALLEHAELNVNSLTNLVNHIDELYIADLSEKSNKQTFWLSLLIAGLSLSVTLFSLPSFWADAVALNEVFKTEIAPEGVLSAILLLGNIFLGPFVILIMPVLFIVILLIRQRRQIKRQAELLRQRLRREQIAQIPAPLAVIEGESVDL